MGGESVKKEKGKKKKQKAGRDRVEVSINLEGEKEGFVLSVEARLVLGVSVE